MEVRAELGEVGTVGVDIVSELLGGAGERKRGRDEKKECAETNRDEEGEGKSSHGCACVCGIENTVPWFCGCIYIEICSSIYYIKIE